MMQHQYPFCVLYFEMNSELLDVNVHPTKMELRFSQNEEIYRSLFEIIRNTISHRDFIPEVPVTEEKKEMIPPVPKHTPEPFEIRRRGQDAFLKNETDQCQSIDCAGRKLICKAACSRSGNKYFQRANSRDKF